ncbi:MAG TPA: DUF4124 domain-containing protein [Chiayiivirga sp.]|nr:DUF4124 domain-containing protein [Chiayiivirga sp.]
MSISIRLPLVFALLAFALATLSPDAQAQRKLYRWTDAEGNVHYTDSLPAEAVQDKQEEINNLGMAVKTTERALTPEEQAAYDAEQARLAVERAAAEEQAKMDSVLIGSYPTESDLERAYRERFDLIEQSIVSAQVGIRSQEKSLGELLEHAADLERNGKPVPVAVRDSIKLARAQVDEQRGYLQKRENEKKLLSDEHDKTLSRYRELKTIEAKKAEERSS